MPLLDDALPGALGGILLVLVGQPFDNVRMRLALAPAGSTTIHTALSIARGEGLRGFYRGVSPILIGVVPVFAVCMSAYGAASASLRTLHALPLGAPLPLLDVALAGAASAVATASVLIPGERLRVLAMARGGASPHGGGVHFKGPLDAARHVLRTKGVAGLYRGGGLTLARETLGSACYFATYEAVRRGLASGDSSAGSSPRQPSVAAVLLAGALAGQAYWLAGMPLDVLKTRRQVQLGTEEARALTLAQELFRAEGLRGFYRGLLPALLRAAPANAAFFAGVEATTSAIAWSRRRAEGA